MNDNNFYCNVSGLSDKEKNRYRTFEKTLFQDVNSIDEILNGYTLTFPRSPEKLMLISEFITYEERCCSFLSFTIKLKSEENLISFDIFGAEGAKQFIKSELGISIYAHKK